MPQQPLLATGAHVHANDVGDGQRREPQQKDEKVEHAEREGDGAHQIHRLDSEQTEQLQQE